MVIQNDLILIPRRFNTTKSYSLQNVIFFKAFDKSASEEQNSFCLIGFHFSGFLREGLKIPVAPLQQQSLPDTDLIKHLQVI